MDDPWDFSDGELGTMLSGAPQPSTPLELQPPAEVRVFSELGTMCCQIAAQYVDVIASYAAIIFQGKGSSEALEAVLSAGQALLRLAEACQDVQLTELSETLLKLSARPTRRRRERLKLQSEFRDWIVKFADYLPDEDRDRLKKLVEYDFRTQPLLLELSSLRGIGRRRLLSLHTAGLFEVQVLSSATPAEVAAATGIPMKLAEDVVEAATGYSKTQRTRTIESLRRTVSEFARAIRNQGLQPEQDQGLMALAQESLQELQDVLAAGSVVSPKLETPSSENT